jgi:hypothetical protein
VTCFCMDSEVQLHSYTGSGMVLCEEIIQWLSQCGGQSGAGPAASNDNGKASAFSVQRSDSAASDSPRVAYASSPSQTASRNVLRSKVSPHQRAHGTAEWTVLKQLSHELGKNLGEEGSRSSPLSPSDLTGHLLFSVSFTTLRSSS